MQLLCTSIFLINLQVKVDWENINSKIDAEYQRERERPGQTTAVK